jgi:hypothetical protein
MWKVTGEAAITVLMYKDERGGEALWAEQPAFRSLRKW